MGRLGECVVRVVAVQSWDEDSLIFAPGLYRVLLEQRLEDELVLPRIVVWIGSRDATKGRVAKLLIRAVVVRYVEVRRVGDVEGLNPELNCRPFGDREVLEQRQINVTEVRAEHRVALGVTNRSQGLRSEG